LLSEKLLLLAIVKEIGYGLEGSIGPAGPTIKWDKKVTTKVTPAEEKPITPTMLTNIVWGGLGVSTGALIWLAAYAGAIRILLMTTYAFAASTGCR
jgi:hypothetical protein